MVEEIFAINSKILENCTHLEIKLPSNKIVPKLRDDAELMKMQLPAIVHLRNTALKPRHWTIIEQIINRQGLQNDSITLCAFEEANIFDVILTKKIISISEQASIEMELEVLLESVEDSWKELELTTTPYRDSKDVFVLTKFEVIQSILDDSMLKVNRIAASDFVGHIKEQVDEWKMQLDLFEKTLDAWEVCQSLWTQLETVFSAADIQRQLSMESEIFNEVDRSWKEVMKMAHKSPHALQCMTNEGTLKNLQKNIEDMDMIRVKLESYLETKRVAFPRYSCDFFLIFNERCSVIDQIWLKRLKRPMFKILVEPL